MRIRVAIRDDVFLVSHVQVDSNRSTYIGIMTDDYLNNLSYESIAKSWEERLFNQNSKEFMYVAETDKAKIIGFASASLVSTHGLYERELSAIYLLNEFQHKGIGKMLIKAIVQKYTQDNVRSMILWTLQNNPSRFFYEHLGGEIVGKRIINRGGKELMQIAYAWEDITRILEC